MNQCLPSPCRAGPYTQLLWSGIGAWPRTLARAGNKSLSHIHAHVQAALAAVFALATLATTLNANGLPLLQPDQLQLSAESVLPALPGTALLLLLLGEHCCCVWASILPPACLCRHIRGGSSFPVFLS